MLVVSCLMMMLASQENQTIHPSCRWGWSILASSYEWSGFYGLASSQLIYYFEHAYVTCMHTYERFHLAALPVNAGNVHAILKINTESFRWWLVNYWHEWHNFLRRNLRGCPYKLRELGYISLVRSSLEYCGAIWDTTSKDEADRLEMIQRRAARWARGAHGIIKQNHMVVAYFPWYFTRRPAWKPRPRRGSGFHAGSPCEVSWKICNNKCGFVFIPRLYP